MLHINIWVLEATAVTLYKRNLFCQQRSSAFALLLLQLRVRAANFRLAQFPFTGLQVPAQLTMPVLQHDSHATLPGFGLSFLFC